MKTFIVILTFGIALSLAAPAMAATLRFDGVSGQVIVGPSTLLKISDTTATWEAWIHPAEQGASANMIMNREGEYEFARLTSGNLGWAIANTSPGWTFADTGIFAPLNVWMHVAFVYDGSNMRLYTNGVLASSQPASGNIGDAVTAQNDFRIGARQAGPSSFFNGQLDEVRVWNVTRSAAEVAAWVNRPLAGSEAGLLGYYRFNEGFGAVARDATTNDLFGTFSGGVFWNRAFDSLPGPIPESAPATLVTSTNAVLNALVNTNRTRATNFFRWGPGSTALSFDGVDDQVIVPHDTTLNSYPLTLTAWVRVEPGSDGGIMNKYAASANGWRMFVSAGRVRAVYFRDANNRLAGNTPGSSEVVTVPIDDGQWHHVAFTVDASGGKVYLDGALSGNAPWVGTPGQATIGADVQIGWAGGVFLNGQLDDAAIWNAALSQSAISNLIAAGQTIGHEQYSNVVAHWSMDAGAGTILTDVSGQGQDGAFSSEPVWKAEARPVLTNQTPKQLISGTNSVLDLDGVDDYVDVPDGVWFNGDFTIEFKAFVRSYPTYAHFLDFGNGTNRDNVLVTTSAGAGGRIELHSYSNNVPTVLASPAPVPANEWVHLAITLQGTQASMYLNGTLWARGTVNVPRSVVRTNVFLGRSNWPADPFADALMDDVRIWNTARTAAQIRQFMNQSVAPSDPTLRLNYRFDESSGATVFDSRTTAPQNGTLFNGAVRLPESPVATSLTGLAPGTVYHSQLFVESTNGLAKSALQRFATPAPGRGTALDFDGQNDHVTGAVPQLPVANSPYTIEAWIKPNVMDAGGIVGWGNYGVNNQVNALRLNGPSGLQHYWWNNDLPANTGPLTDGWHHVAATFDGTVRKVYLDGVVRASELASGHNVTTTANFAIGKTVNQEYFNGQIDEVRIWNIARSDLDILHYMNERLVGSEPGLVLYNRMDDASGFTTRDDSINANHLLLAGRPAWIGSEAGVAIPIAITTHATPEIGFGAARLNGTINRENSQTVSYWFEYGEGNLNLRTNGLQLSPGVPVEPVSITATNLGISPVHQFRLVAANGNGTNYGSIQEFIMPVPGARTALEFDGVNDTVNLGASPALKITGTTGTWEAWIRPTAYRDMMILNKEGEYEIGLFANGQLWWALSITSPNWVAVQTGIIPPLNRWTHVAFAYNGTNIILYTNGVATRTNAASGAIGDAFNLYNELRVGSRQGANSPTSFWQGGLDEVRIWNVARSAADIAASFNRSLILPATGLLVYLKFDEGSGTTATNLALSIHGTLSGAPSGPVWGPSAARIIDPVPVTLTASPVLATSATLRGTVNPSGEDVVTFFEYGTTTAYGTPTTSQNHLGSLATLSLSAPLTGLEPGTIYYYRMVARSLARTNYGANQTFTTLVLGSGWPVSTKLTGGEASSPLHVLDGLGNTYVAGVFSGSAKFRTPLSPQGGAAANAFVGKMSRSADWLWTTNIPASANGFTSIKAMALDADRNVYVAGQFSGTNTFGSTNLISNNDTNLFVAKTDGTNWLWARAVGGVGPDSANAIAVVGTNVFVAGSFSGTANFTVSNLVSVGGSDAFVASLDSGGNWRWANRGGGTGNDFATTLATDASTDVYVAGQFSAVATFGSTPPTTLTNAGGSDLFLAKLTGAAGSWLLARRGGSVNNDIATALVRDAAANQFYLVGQFGGPADYGVPNLNSLGGTNIFVLRLNADAAYQGYVQGGAGSARGATVDGLGRLYVAGDFPFTTSFGTNSLISSGNNDVFVARLEDGDWKWAQKIGAAGNETAGSISADSDNSVVVSGTYQGTIQIGYVALSSPNNQDIFVARFDTNRVYEHNNYIVGQAIPVPEDAQDPNYGDGAIDSPAITILEKDQPNSDAVNSFVWSDAEHKLFPVRQVTAILKWPLTAGPSTNTVSAITVVGRSRFPTNPQIHVANAPAELEPNVAGFPLKFAGVAFTTIPGVDAGTQPFQAAQPGWSVIRFLDSGGQQPDSTLHPSVFEVVQTVAWNDPAYLKNNQPAVVGTALTNTAHTDPAGKNGYVLFERAFYDGAGEDRAYDRTSRTGPILPVNRKTHATNDDLVVVWYGRSPVTGIGWPDKPFLYSVSWPADAPERELVLASGTGSGVLDPMSYPAMRVYNQPDPSLPGYNPNEEHAALYGTILYALRNDLNTGIGASDPYVLLKYQDPNSQWAMRVFKVVMTNMTSGFTYSAEAGKELLLPPPLGLLSLCGHSNWIVSGPGFKDYQGRLYARAAGTNSSGATIVARYSYPLQPQFFYDLDRNGQPDAPAGTCVPWLDRANVPGQTNVPGQSIDITYNVTWPANAPVLQIGETLLGEKFGLPDIRNFANAQVIFDQGNPGDTNALDSLVRLFDPLRERTLQLPDDFVLPSDIGTANQGGRKVFTALPYVIRSRLLYDDLNKRLSFRGLLDGNIHYGGPDNPLLLINVLSPRERDRIKDINISGDSVFQQAIEDLYDLTRNPNRLDINPKDGTADKSLLIGLRYEVRPDGTTNTNSVVHEKLGDSAKALTAGPGTGSGFVTIVENNDPALGGLPVRLHVIRVASGPFRGDLKVILSDNIFDEKLTIRHSADFGGEPQRFEFQWYYQPDSANFDPALLPTVLADGQIDNPNGWIRYTNASLPGFNDITFGDGGESGLLVLGDNWVICRYRGYVINGQTNWSDWAGDIEDGEAQFAEGWVKRVRDRLGPFEARTTNFHASESITFASMLQQAGTRYEDDIAFGSDPGKVNNVGLIEAYETMLRRARRLSIDGAPPVNYQPANDALLLAAGFIADLYLLLGNEAYADASDPTIGFRTASAGYGTLAPSIFTFQNQLDSLLEEELGLLRGRDDRSATVRSAPVYNRLFWNFTRDEGEVAYAQAYNITDQNRDGIIDANDARIMYPQAHGDAWGHYLTATKTYYSLLQNPQFDWIPRSEFILLAGSRVKVDYLDERKFARAAAAKAKTGAEIVDLSYRLGYVDDPNGQFQGYKDTDASRAWGLAEWGNRAGSAAFFDWVLANAILPATDTNANHTGIDKIDRTTVPELNEIVSGYESVQVQVDKADAGLNPLGLAKNVVPFDIDPALISSGKTHFEQIYDRAIEAMNNTVTVFNHANQLSQALRSLQDTTSDFSKNTGQQERDYKNRLIEVFGYPYAGDIGAGKTYPAGYDGPDLYHYMYVNSVEFTGDPEALVTNTVGGGGSLFTPGRAPIKAFFKPFRNLAIGAIGFVFPADLPANVVLPATDVLEVEYPVAASEYSFSAPAHWGRRRAPGELQSALSDILQAETALKRARAEHENHVKEMEAKTELLQAKYDLQAEKMLIRFESRVEYAVLKKIINAARGTNKKVAEVEKKSDKLADAATDAMPKSAGTAVDPSFVMRGIVKFGNILKNAALSIATFIANRVEEDAKEKLDFLEYRETIKIDAAEFRFEVQQELKELEKMLGEEHVKRFEMLTQAQKLDQVAGAYEAALAKGLRLIDERISFRQQTAAETQASRYQDMTFRIFRNDAIQKYRAQYDLAARYVFLAAVAYDFETQLLGDRAGAGSAFLTDIVRQRALGEMINGVPVAGRHGLADPLARLNQNFGVLKGQLGFNNPQTETGRFSLRGELFRMRTNSHDAWRAELKKRIVPNLWDVPEFRRYCRPFAPESAGPQPGLVIRFPTTIAFGYNYFGWPLGGGDNNYDSTLFATKVRSAGVWFSDYDGSGLSLTPRVYLVPVGGDVMRSPSGNNLETREWRVVDQKIPVPFPIGFSSLNNAGWIPMNDSLSDTFADVRRFSSFRAFHDSGVFEPSETISDSRLIGRSVWNTDWMLIIPGGTFLFDSDQGLDTFINSVGDIKIFFQTYAYSGN